MEEGKNNKVIDIKSAKNESQHAFHSKLGDYKPDEDLLQSTARIKKQRDVILDRLGKMESAQERVNQNVFAKVKRDYNLQLKTINELLDEKKDLLKKEINDLYMRREKLSVEISRHKDILEEAEFRHYLDEFSQNQYQEVENYESREIEKLQSDLEQIAHFIKIHEDLFDPKDLGETAPSKSSQPRQKELPAGEVTKTAAMPAETELPKKTITSDQRPVTSDQEFDASEFEDLFLEDESVKEKEKQLAESQSNIKKLIREDEERPMPFPKAGKKAQNYFKQEEVEESSLTVKKGDLAKGEEQEETTPRPVKKSGGALQSQPGKQPQAVSEDSISDILKNISLDEESPHVEQEKEEIPLEEKAKPQAACFLKVTEGEMEQTEFPLKENLSIGRSPSNDIVIKAPKVSRQHAAINFYNNQYIIIDLKSANGVFVNGTKVDECVLNPGDEISIGGYKFVFEKRA